MVPPCFIRSQKISFQEKTSLSAPLPTRFAVFVRLASVAVIPFEGISPTLLVYGGRLNRICYIISPSQDMSIPREKGGRDSGVGDWSLGTINSTFSS